MKPLLILNDVHIGVKREAGTTPASQCAVQAYIRTEFELTLQRYLDHDLLIAGDLFDGFFIDPAEMLKTYYILADWLKQSGNTLLLMAGNHDIGKRNDRLSSFDLLASFLVARFESQVKVIKDELYTHAGNIHVIPHCMNQDLFDLELQKARDLPDGVVVLHANIDNGFTENSDHSLNVEATWLSRLTKKHVLMFAHEHQNRILRFDGGKSVFAMGNQWPSSISDCLAHGEAQKDGTKYAHVIRESFEDPGEYEFLRTPTWKREGDFEQQDWTDLQASPAHFIRVTGSASAEQAAEVINAVAKFRQQSDAFVITNAVVINGVAGMDELAELTFEQVKAVNVLDALLEMLTAEEGAVIKQLLEPKEGGDAQAV